MTTPPFLSVIIPAFNEAPRIIPTLEKIAAFASAQPYAMEVIVVDDCSRDKTFEIVSVFIRDRPIFRLVKNPVNSGKGASIKKGMGMANGIHRLFSDADSSTPIEEVSKLLAFMEKFDVVIGSRRVAGANVAVRQPVYREAAGRLFSVLVRLLVLRGFIDTQCGFKLFSAKAADQVFPRQTIRRFGFDVEILFIARRHGFQIKETGITWYDSPDTKVRLLRDSADMFLDLVRVRWNFLKGRYR